MTSDLTQAMGQVTQLQAEARESAAEYRRRIREAKKRVFAVVKEQLRGRAVQQPLPLEAPPIEEVLKAIAAEVPAADWARLAAVEELAADLEAHVPGLRHAFVRDPLVLAKGDLAPLCVCGKRESDAVHAREWNP